MSSTRIASRYAKSLLDLAGDFNKVEEVKGDVEGILKVMENRDFFLLLKSPIVSISKKSSIFKELFEGKLDKLTMEFLSIVLRKGRESHLPEIAQSFINQYRDSKEITTVELTTAYPISEDNLEKIKNKLKSAGVTSNNLVVNTKVDESIIGGFIAKIGDTLIDDSVAFKLKDISKSILN